MKVVWTEQAAARLEEIEDYIARHSSPARAEKFVVDLIRRTERQLSRQPRSGRPLPELPGSRLRERIHDGYRVVYRLQRTAIEVLTVFNGRRLLPREELPDDE